MENTVKRPSIETANDMIINLYERDYWSTSNKFNVRRLFISDKNRLLAFLKESFPDEHGWAIEAESACMSGDCFIAVLNKEIVGFACYDCSGKGYFGPFGVSEKHRGSGAGTELLYACLNSMKAVGYGYAILGWVDDTARGFYLKAANAHNIENSTPKETLFSRKVNL